MLLSDSAHKAFIYLYLMFDITVHLIINLLQILSIIYECASEIILNIG